MRVKLIVMGVLLCLAIIGAVIATIATVQAFQRFQQTRHLVLTGDVRAIQPWMTIHHISLVYHVPENYLYEALNIPRSHNERLSLTLLAGHYKRPVNELIREIQVAILIYREKHLSQGFHPPPFTSGYVATLSNLNRNRYMNKFMVSS